MAIAWELVRIQVWNTETAPTMAGRAFNPGLPDEAYISTLQRIIAELHNCSSEYAETVHIKETVPGRVLWEGNVEVFTLIIHPRAKRCFAWIRRQGRSRKRVRFFAVLGTGVVRNALGAVRFAHLITNAQLVNEFSRLGEQEGPSDAMGPPNAPSQ